MWPWNYYSGWVFFVAMVRVVYNMKRKRGASGACCFGPVFMPTYNWNLPKHPVRFHVGVFVIRVLFFWVMLIKILKKGELVSLERIGRQVVKMLLLVKVRARIMTICLFSRQGREFLVQGRVSGFFHILFLIACLEW